MAGYNASSLAYIDMEYGHPAMENYVDRLIEAEMATFTPPDYLRDRAPMPEFSSALLKVRLLAYCGLLFVG